MLRFALPCLGVKESKLSAVARLSASLLPQMLPPLLRPCFAGPSSLGYGMICPLRGSTEIQSSQVSGAA